MSDASNDASEQSEQLAPIVMGGALRGLRFQPHSVLCARFAERTRDYLSELEDLTSGLEAAQIALTTLAAAQAEGQATQAAQTEAPGAVLTADTGDTWQALATQVNRLCDRMFNLRAELNAHCSASALACPECAIALNAQPWPLPDVRRPSAQVVQTTPARTMPVTDEPKRGEPALLSEALRRELRQRRAAQN